MIRKILVPLVRGAGAVAFLAALFSTSAACAQTTYVNCGTNASGAVVYLEVYEYDYVTEKPSFPGGEEKLLKYVNRTRVYPESAYRQGIQGRVMCSFVVRADGSVGNVHIIRGVEPSLNCEAKRVISNMPAWRPGRMNGRPVPVRVVYPIAFRR